MPVKYYGYVQADRETLLELGEVTVCVNPAQALALSEFFAKCAQAMAENPRWEHEHFSEEGEVKLVVYNTDTLQADK